MSRVLCRLITVALIGWAPCAALVAGDEPAADYHELSLEELLDTPVEIASRQKQKATAAPSIVTVVSRADIEAWGVSDLAGVLRLAGGFELGIDVESLVGAGFRGVWIHEGKALVMINGQQVNDFAYGNVNYLGSYPAAMIERVEIIRGPGSALYGGFAEVAVINVITARGNELKGGRVRGWGGSLGGEGAWGGQFTAGGVTAEGVDIALQAGFSDQALSGRDYTDYYGNVLPQNRDTAGRRWWHAALDAGTERWRLKYLHIDQRFGGQDVFDEIAPPVNGQFLEDHKFNHDVLTGSLVFKPSESVTVEPLVEYIRTTPLDAPVNPGEMFAGVMGTNAAMARMRGEVVVNWTMADGGRLIAGGGAQRDRAHNVADDGTPGFQLSADPADVASDVDSDSWYLMGQYSRGFGPLGVTVGARYEDTDFGSALAPRAGLTWVRGAFNAKLLYGRAYRIPTLFQNFETDYLGLNLVPETANTLEVELGWTSPRGLAARVNLFTLTVDDIIAFSGATNTYANSGSVKTRGAELEVRWVRKDVNAFLNGAWYEPRSGSSMAFTDETGKKLLGMPQLKFNAGVVWHPGRFTLTPTVTWLGERRGQTANSLMSGVAETERFPSVFLAGLSAGVALPRGFEISAAAHNVFDEDYALLQPYYGGHAPMPAGDRHWTLSLGRKF